MNEFFGSVWWLIVTLGLLITFHEYGHFVVARRCGVKVLKFSIGFGKAFAAIADDATAVYWNPAGLAALDRAQGAFVHSRPYGIEGLSSNYAAVAFPARSVSLGASWHHFGAADVLSEDTFSLAAAREAHQLRRPVPAGEEGVEPLEQHDPWPLLDLPGDRLHLRDARLEARDHFAGPILHSRGFPDQPDALEHLGQFHRFEVHDPWLARQ